MKYPKKPATKMPIAIWEKHNVTCLSREQEQEAFKNDQVFGEYVHNYRLSIGHCPICNTDLESGYCPSCDEMYARVKP